MACGRHPDCGTQGGTALPTTSSIGSDIGVLIGIASGLASAAKALADKTVWSFIVSGPMVVWIGALAGAAITAFVVFDFWRHRCLTSPDTVEKCTSGVVEHIVPSFNSATDEIFPFTAMHDRVDVVVKCDYWPLVENLAAFIHCNSDPQSSPILRGYYKDDQVCAAGGGATIGAVAGGAVGVFLGVLAGAAIASLACGPLAWLCLILAVVVAAVVAAAVALAGAFLGGQAGKLIAGEDEPTSDEGVVRVGNYLSSTGGLLTSGDDEGARVYWFVETTIFHGDSTGGRPFSHEDPDVALTDPGTGMSLDACGMPTTLPPIR